MIFETLCCYCEQNVSSETYVLTGAIIGAIISALGLITNFLLIRNKEIKNKKRELLSEERRIANLLLAYLKIKINQDVSAGYYFKSSEFNFALEGGIGVPEGKKQYEHCLTFEAKSTETFEKISIALSDYFKTVTLFNTLSDNKNNLEKILLEILEININDEIDNFVKVVSLNDLPKAKDDKIDNLINIYHSTYSKIFDKMKNEMKNISNL